MTSTVVVDASAFESLTWLPWHRHNTRPTDCLVLAVITGSIRRHVPEPDNDNGGCQ